MELTPVATLGRGEQPRRGHLMILDVILPTFNREALLERTLDSLARGAAAGRAGRPRARRGQRVDRRDESARAAPGEATSAAACTISSRQRLASRTR